MIYINIINNMKKDKEYKIKRKKGDDKIL